MAHKPLKVLIEASGCLTSTYMIESIKAAGHLVCGSDIDSFNASYAYCDDFIIMPRSDSPTLWEETTELLLARDINVVIPTLDESLLGWSERREYFSALGIVVLLSPPHTIETFIDKWRTYTFFREIGIPTPQSALYHHYGILKPRFGRGGSGIERERDIKRFYSDSILESTSSAIASPKNTADSKTMDCHEAATSRNDGKTESNPHASLESKVDSKSASAVGQCHTAIESHSGDKQGLSPALKASSGWGIVKGEGATSQFKPLPLNKKENTESNEVLESKEVKAKDSEKLDSESRGRAESAMALDSEKWDFQGEVSCDDFRGCADASKGDKAQSLSPKRVANSSKSAQETSRFIGGGGGIHPKNASTSPKKKSSARNTPLIASLIAMGARFISFPVGAWACAMGNPPRARCAM